VSAGVKPVRPFSCFIGHVDILETPGTSMDMPPIKGWAPFSPGAAARVGLINDLARFLKLRTEQGLLMNTGSWR